MNSRNPTTELIVTGAGILFGWLALVLITAAISSGCLGPTGSAPIKQPAREPATQPAPQLPAPQTGAPQSAAAEIGEAVDLVAGALWKHVRLGRVIGDLVGSVQEGRNELKGHADQAPEALRMFDAAVGCMQSDATRALVAKIKRKRNIAHVTNVQDEPK